MLPGHDKVPALGPAVRVWLRALRYGKTPRPIDRQRECEAVTWRRDPPLLFLLRMMCWGLIQILGFQGMERCMQCGLRLAGSSDVELSILVAITKSL